ncbi:Cytochrome P450 monooxygenase [Lachnellula subtilissima]|uniref:Cytochrome P450 monooxygenase n=1 Tax=Lachnellula subtilissima TaxID=602034 RepID=A0A8H8RF84_9HELO|nr:Cytochrome P450 monooxygenase [Lachnellula subtilissima]
MAFSLAEQGVIFIVGAGLCCFLFYLTLRAFYRITLHPLASYPGPTLWSISDLPSAYQTFQGTLPFKISSLHAKYGPVVRIGPNNLTYIVEEAWTDIYARKVELRKDPSQFVIVGEEKVSGLLTAPDEEAHSRMRRNLAHGFSEKALRGQEYIIRGYVDLLMQRLHENCGKGTVDIAKWLNFASFDIIGDLTFGESFNCLETSNMHKPREMLMKKQFWVQLIFDNLKSISLLGLMKKFPPLDKILLSLLPQNAMGKQQEHLALTEAKMMRRLKSQESRLDFLSEVQNQINKPSGMSKAELLPTVNLLIVAGSETTANLLSATSYFILTNPSCLSNLQAEVRNAFKTEEEINIVSVNSLSYMLAILNEVLRLYPPSPTSFNRLTPLGGCQIAGKFVPGNTSVAVNQWAANHSATNFVRADEFIPERWMGADEFAVDNRRAVQPFSVGRRGCIGRNLAYAEMRLILARLVWNFDVELAEESRDWMKNPRVFLVYEKRPLLVHLKPVIRG